MNADKLNMIAGSAIGALLVFVLLGFFGGKIFDTRGGHGDHDEPLAFAVEIEESGGDVEEVATDYAALAAVADIGKGQKLFSKCAACHKVADGANGVGPHLHGVVGRDIASVSGYAFSGALEGIDGNWELENLSAFLKNPKGWAPGTKMGYGGMKKDEDRVNLIAWLNTQSDAPIELAAAPAETATDAVEEGTEEATDEGAPAEETEATESEATETEVTGEVVEEATEEATEAVEEATEEAAEATEEVTEEATEEVATAVTEEASEAVEEVTEATSEAAEATETAVEEATEEVAAAATGATEDVTEAVEETTEAASEAAEEATEEVTEEVAAVATGGAYAALLAEASAKSGKKVFRKCRACHKIDEGKNSVGPSLYGVINRDIASVDGFKYSDALANKEGAWNLDNLMGFLEAPKSWAKGTKMGFAGLKSEQDRINVITYLNEEAMSAPVTLE